MLTDVYEPDWPNFNPSNTAYEFQKRLALDYARIELSNRQLKNETIKYIEKHNLYNNSKALEILDEGNFFIVGKYAWILNNGGLLASESMDFFKKQLKNLFNKLKRPIKKPSQVKTSVKNKVEGNALYQALEDLILEGKLTENGDSVYELLRETKPKPGVIRIALEKIQDTTKFLKSCDDEYQRSFKNYNQTLEDFEYVLRYAKTYKTNSKIRRRTQNEKQKATGKAAKALRATEDLNYKKEDTSLKLVSINPMDVIGSDALLVYNSDKRKIGLFYASKNEQLEIRGTTVHNFDGEKSFQKTLRQPLKQIETLRGASLKRIEIVLKENIKGKNQNITGRINESVILMKCWKN